MVIGYEQINTAMPSLACSLPLLLAAHYEAVKLCSSHHQQFSSHCYTLNLSHWLYCNLREEGDTQEAGVRDIFSSTTIGY